MRHISAISPRRAHAHFKDSDLVVIAQAEKREWEAEQIVVVSRGMIDAICAS